MVEERLPELNRGLMRKMNEFEAMHEIAQRSREVIRLNNYVTPLDKLHRQLSTLQRFLLPEYLSQI